MDIKDKDSLDLVYSDVEENAEYNEEVFRDKVVKIVYNNKSWENE